MGTNAVEHLTRRLRELDAQIFHFECDLHGCVLKTRTDSCNWLAHSNWCFHQKFLVNLLLFPILADYSPGWFSFKLKSAGKVRHHHCCFAPTLPSVCARVRASNTVGFTKVDCVETRERRRQCSVVTSSLGSCPSIPANLLPSALVRSTLAQQIPALLSLACLQFNVVSAEAIVVMFHLLRWFV